MFDLEKPTSPSWTSIFFFCETETRWTVKFLLSLKTVGAIFFPEHNYHIQSKSVTTHWSPNKVGSWYLSGWNILTSSNSIIKGFMTALFLRSVPLAEPDRNGRAKLGFCIFFWRRNTSLPLCPSFYNFFLLFFFLHKPKETKHYAIIQWKGKCWIEKSGSCHDFIKYESCFSP